VNGYVVYLYKEGDPMDGEEFVCGTYQTEKEAEEDAVKLAKYGSVRVLLLNRDADTLLDDLRML
jgi:hypothetical protein